MAPYKKPLTLQKLSLKAIAVLINRACNILHTVHGKYDPLLCKSDITDIQNHLLSYIPRDFIDEVCKEWINMVINYDPRLCIAVYMHRHMKEFNFGQIHAAVSSYCDCSFWRSLLCQTSSIVSINLVYMCTDEILEVVGENCCNLEYINISSPCFGKYGALFSYPLRVTDKGLKHLEKCKNLKTVEMDKHIVIRSSKKVSIEGIRHLLKNLPVVENISFGEMGTVIVDNMQDIKSLSLLSIIEIDAKLEHILAISRLCPNLKSLTCFSYIEAPDILNAITESTLNLSAFRFNFYYIDRSIFDFLIVKGLHLTALHLTGIEITERLVKAVGKCCPNMTSLTLNQFDNMKDKPDLSLPDSNETIFSKLESLKVYGSKRCMFFRWESYIQMQRILQTILKDASKIQMIKLYISNNDSFDDVFNVIFQSNPLTELTELFAGCSLNIKTILYFFRRPNMRKLTLRRFPSITNEDYFMLMNEISQNNFDVSLQSLHALES